MKKFTNCRAGKPTHFSGGMKARVPSDKYINKFVPTNYYGIWEMEAVKQVGV